MMFGGDIRRPNYIDYVTKRVSGAVCQSLDYVGLQYRVPGTVHSWIYVPPTCRRKVSRWSTAVRTVLTVLQTLFADGL